MSGKSICEYTFSGEIDISAIRSFFNVILDEACSEKARGIIVDVSGLEGSMGIMETFSVVSSMEPFRDCGIKVAAVFGDKISELDEFGITVAKNRCIPYRRFKERAAAVEWINE